MKLKELYKKIQNDPFVLDLGNFLANHVEIACNIDTLIYYDEAVHRFIIYEPVTMPNIDIKIKGHIRAYPVRFKDKNGSLIIHKDIDVPDLWILDIRQGKEVGTLHMTTADVKMALLRYFNNF